ncbi:hypothetical protein DM02DRAFT_648996 [Periconia macrospinosa]|uniref:Mtf2-like C-terminal domain-containing protein n=1 Tax=Periconia macrospinosa TaxID=97972 RepID=A0A2V1EAE8_9PLEO|nr:hypothetical protein DM02DRAFT_648996 [Periconia macrospinosa]
MSICWCSYRALSRPRLPPPAKSLVPFLYQTATLQQCRRHASSRPPYRHDGIPFEDELQSPDAPQQPPRNTTITGSERAAFERLYKKFSAPKSGPRELDEFSEEDPAYDNTEKGLKDDSLDTLFDDVLAGRVDPLQISKTPQKAPKKPKPKPNLATVAAQILKPKISEAKINEKRLAEQKQATLKAIQRSEKDRITTLLVNAKTDRELWQILEKEVFEPVTNLELDAYKKQGKQKKEKKHANSPVSVNPDSRPFPTSPTNATYNPSVPNPSPRDPRVLFPNYPSLVSIAANQLHKNFPTSPLLFSILPSLKSQGRSSYALGATSGLYRVVIRAAWKQNASYSLICNLLQEMDNSGIDFDHTILSLLNSIRDEYFAAKSGKLGRAYQLVINMEFFKQDMIKLIEWRDVVDRRLGTWTEEKKATGGALIKRTLSQGPGSRSTPRIVRGNVVLSKQDSGDPFEEIGKDHIPLVEDMDQSGRDKNNEHDVPFVEDAKDGHEGDVPVDNARN